jgi:hypothetical protein
MGNFFSQPINNPLSSNESTPPINLNQIIINLRRMILTLESNNKKYKNDLIIKQGQAKGYVKINNMEAARIVAQQVLRYDKMIKRNMKTIEQLDALIKKLQETKNKKELRELINQANTIEISQQNPLFKGGEYMEKLIKYEDKMLELISN